MKMLWNSIEYVYIINFTEDDTNSTYLLYKNTKDLDFNTKLVAGDGISITLEEGNKLKFTNTESSTSIVELQDKVATIEETLPIESFDNIVDLVNVGTPIFFKSFPAK